jgi:hypothetical protein
LSLAVRLEEAPTSFWEQYELGRRWVFERGDHLGAVFNLLEIYESEAQRSANAKAYYAAVTMLGSAAEAHLLLECLRQRRKAMAAAKRLPSGKRPASPDPLKWTLANLVSIAKEAGWLPSIDDGEIVHIVEGWVHRLRGMRNLLHPGRHILEKPHVTIGHQQWFDAESAYTTLRHAIETARRAKRTRNARKT